MKNLDKKSGTTLVTLFFSETMKEESRLFGMLCVTQDKKEGIRASGSKDPCFEASQSHFPSY